jgi:predicted HTH transcriptional regulator
MTIETRYKNARRYAESKGLEFSLSLYQYTRLIKSPCAYAHREQQDIVIGLDRKDSTRGYTVENSAPCCYRHNVFKNDVLTYAQTDHLSI